MADDPAPLLRDARQEAGDVDERHERDVERVARADEARGLDRCVDVEHAGESAGLVADDADGVPAEPREAAHDVLREVRCTSRNSPSSTTRSITSFMSYGLFGLSGTIASSEASSRSTGSAGAAHGGARGCSAAGTRGGSAHPRDSLLVRRREVGDAGLGRMRRRAPELLERHVLAGHGLHDVGPGDEHVRRLLDHEHEVGDRRRVHGPAGARPHHERDLRDDTRSLDVAPEDLRVARPARRHPPGSARRPSR